MRYKEAVTEARQLLKRSEADQWRLAELTAEVLGGGKSTRDWASDIGVSHVHVSYLAKVWDAYGVNPVNARPTFANAYAEAKGMPIDRDERRLREAVSNLRSAPVERRTEIITELISDPEVREGIREEFHREARDRPIPIRTLNDQWHDWLNRANTLFTNGARLASATDSETVELDAHAAAARVLYDRLVERQIDAEIRTFMEEMA